MITSVRPYFRQIMKILGFDEWRKSLEPDNFPKSLLKDVYHLKTETIGGIKQNQRDIEVSVRIQITFAKKAGRDEVAAYESAEETVQDIVKQILTPVNKQNAPGILNISFVGAEPAGLATTNDNVLLTRATFLAVVILAV